MSTSPDGVLLFSSVGTVAPVIMEASSPLTKRKGLSASKVIQAARQSFFGRDGPVGLAVFDLFLLSVGEISFFC